MRQLPLSLLLLSACVTPQTTSPNTGNSNGIFAAGSLAVEGSAMVLTAPWSTPTLRGFFQNATLGLYDSAVITTGNVGAKAGGTVGLPNDPNTPCYLSGCQFAVGAPDAGFSEPFGVVMAITGYAGEPSVPVFTASVSKAMIQAANAAHTAPTQTVAFALTNTTLQTIATALNMSITQMTKTGFLIGIVLEGKEKITAGGLPPFVQGATVTVSNTAPVQLYFPDDNVTTYGAAGGLTNKYGMFFAASTNVAAAAPATLDLSITGAGNTWEPQTVGIAPNSVTVGVFYAE